MKNIVVILLLLFCTNTLLGQEIDEVLRPTESQKKVQQFVSQFLNNYHFKKFKIDDSLSTKIFDNYLENLDRGKNYFLATQVKGFENYRYSLDEAVLNGDLTAAYDIFNTYRESYLERNQKIVDYINSGLDYYTDNEYLIEENPQWKNSSEELDEEWNSIILSQALSMKLSGSTDSAIAATMTKRYQRYEKRALKWSSQDVFQSFMNAFTETLDPHTSYMIPKNAEQFNIDMSQSLEGIGARLINEEDYVMIKDIIPGGPLFKTNQATNDEYILAVAQGDDGEFQDIIGWLTGEAVELIRGKKGTVVRLKLLPASAPVGTPPHEVRIVREKIKLEEAVASSEVIQVEDHQGKIKNVGLIDIPMFYRDFASARSGDDFQSTTKDVKLLLNGLKEEGVEAVIIDLRNNGGGSLTEAIDLTGLFIADGPVVQRKRGKGRVSQEYDTDDAVIYTGPLVVLQNRFSASASEIFAGAIQDYQRGLILGEQSFGKGTVQQLVDLDQFLLSPKVASRNKKKANVGFDGKESYGQLKLTTEKFYRISGKSTQRRGVIPDITFPSPFEAEEMGESSRPTALVYDEVSPAKYSNTIVVSPMAKAKVKASYENILKEDDKLISLVEEIEVYRAQKDKQSFSLNYEVRKKENDKNENNRNVLKMLQKSEMTDQDKSNDVYLQTAELIALKLAENWK